MFRSCTTKWGRIVHFEVWELVESCRVRHLVDQVGADVDTTIALEVLVDNLGDDAKLLLEIVILLREVVQLLLFV